MKRPELKDDSARKLDFATPPMPIETTVTTVQSNEALNFSVQDLELVHHYLTATCPTLCLRPEALVIWQHYVFNLSLTNRFLLHGILAISAVHKASTASSPSATQKSYLEASLRHQSLAINLFVPKLNNPTQHTSVALCSFSVLISILTLGSQSLPENLKSVMTGLGQFHESGAMSSSPAPIMTFIEVVEILHGTSAVIRQTWTWLMDSPIRELLLVPDFDALREVPPGAAATLYLLSNRAKRNQLPTTNDKLPPSPSSEGSQLYLLEIETLYRVCKCAQTPVWYSYVLAWLTEVSKEFVELLRQQERLALAMVAFWAACFNSLKNCWWASGWSYTLIKDVSLYLGDEWADILEWPRSVVGL